MKILIFLLIFTIAWAVPQGQPKRPANDHPGMCSTKQNGMKCPSGYCCSINSYCGTTAEHCLFLKGCQSGFGACYNTMPKNMTIPSAKKSTKSTSTTSPTATIPAKSAADAGMPPKSTSANVAGNHYDMSWVIVVLIVSILLFAAVSIFYIFRKNKKEKMSKEDGMDHSEISVRNDLNGSHDKEKNLDKMNIPKLQYVIDEFKGSVPDSASVTDSNTHPYQQSTSLKNNYKGPESIPESTINSIHQSPNMIDYYEAREPTEASTTLETIARPQKIPLGGVDTDAVYFPEYFDTIMMENVLAIRESTRKTTNFPPIQKAVSRSSTIPSSHQESIAKASTVPNLQKPERNRESVRRTRTSTTSFQKNRKLPRQSRTTGISFSKNRASVRQARTSTDVPSTHKSVPDISEGSLKNEETNSHQDSESNYNPTKNYHHFYTVKDAGLLLGPNNQNGASPKIEPKIESDNESNFSRNSLMKHKYYQKRFPSFSRPKSKLGMPRNQKTTRSNHPDSQNTDASHRQTTSQSHWIEDHSNIT